MYAFGPIPRQKRTGRIIGTHQKIDRVARRHLTAWLESRPFPTIEEILHFEGSRGPDGVKIKSPGRDEPRHFIDPKTVSPDAPLIHMITAHSHNLTEALKRGDMTRAAFEAAWLAHAVTDGLTPAHHDPFDEQVKRLRDGDTSTLRDKLVMSSQGSRRQFIRNNWHYWGAKGIMTTHALFEAGVATTAKPLAFKAAAANHEDIEELHRRGFVAIYIDMICAIDSLGMYERFKRDGWTRTLARQTTKELIPTIIHAVELAWLDAYERVVKEGA